MQQQLDVIWNNFTNINWGCHGIPERCLVVKGKRMHVCARCFGCNIGHVFSFILFAFGLLPSWFWGFLFLSIMMFDWSLQEFFKIMSNSYRRVITGIIGGFGAGVLLWSAVGFLVKSIYYLL